jgi:hypothetical protein
MHESPANISILHAVSSLVKFSSQFDKFTCPGFQVMSASNISNLNASHGPFPFTFRLMPVTA